MRPSKHPATALRNIAPKVCRCRQARSRISAVTISIIMATWKAISKPRCACSMRSFRPAVRLSPGALEASRPGLAQYRNEGLPVHAGAFANLSRDHLDYHGDMESYFEAKMGLFE